MENEATTFTQQQQQQQQEERNFSGLFIFKSLLNLIYHFIGPIKAVIFSFLLKVQKFLIVQSSKSNCLKITYLIGSLVYKFKIFL